MNHTFKSFSSSKMLRSYLTVQESSRLIIVHCLIMHEIFMGMNVGQMSCRSIDSFRLMQTENSSPQTSTRHSRILPKQQGASKMDECLFLNDCAALFSRAVVFTIDANWRISRCSLLPGGFSLASILFYGASSRWITWTLCSWQKIMGMLSLRCEKLTHGDSWCIFISMAKYFTRLL